MPLEMVPRPTPRILQMLIEANHKTDAFAPYMFRIVIENSRTRSYYSEKVNIFVCFRFARIAFCFLLAQMQFAACRTAHIG